MKHPHKYTRTPMTLEHSPKFVETLIKCSGTLTLKHSPKWAGTLTLRWNIDHWCFSTFYRCFRVLIGVSCFIVLPFVVSGVNWIKNQWNCDHFRRSVTVSFTKTDFSWYILFSVDQLSFMKTGFFWYILFFVWELVSLSLNMSTEIQWSLSLSPWYTQKYLSL